MATYSVAVGSVGHFSDNKPERKNGYVRRYGVSDTSFEAEVLKSDIPVMVDFWAPWCGPCKAIGPVVDELAKVYSDKIKVVKCNVDDNPSTPGQYGIKAIPTIMLFNSGNVAEQITGMVAKSTLEEAIEKIL
jgi:thioredoxin 1